MTTMTDKEKDLDRAKSQAKAQLAGIMEGVRALETARQKETAEYDGERLSHDDLVERLQEEPLEVSVRSGWHTPREEMEAEEYKILLSTGGPAVRIVGELGQFHEPDSARLEYQDWFTCWTEYPLSSEEDEAVLTYARLFYFGG